MKKILSFTTALFLALSVFLVATPAVAAGSDAALITGFSIGLTDGTIDDTAETVAITVPFGTDVTTLTPTITVSTGATVSPASGAATDFTAPVNYTVTAEDGTTTKIYAVTVTVAAAAAPPSSSGGGSTTVITPVTAPAPVPGFFSGQKWTITRDAAGVSTIRINLAKSQAGKTAKVYKRTIKGNLILLGEMRLGKNGRTVLKTDKPLRPGQKVRVQVDGKFRSTVTIP